MSHPISSEDTREATPVGLASTSRRYLLRLRSAAGRRITSRTLACLVLLTLMVVLFYWKTLLTDQFTLIAGSRGVNVGYTWLHFWVHSIRHGQLPLWDPYAFSGSPFAATLQPSAFYPLQLLFALVPLTKDGFISPRFYHIYLALAHVLCAYFTFALLRELGRTRFASFTGALVFPLSGLLVKMVSPDYVESCIWLPAVFLFLLRSTRVARRDRAMAEAAMGGACLGMSILAGGLAFFFMQAIFAITAIWHNGASLQSTPAHDRRSRWSRMALIITVFLVVAGGVGAVVLWPAAEYRLLSLRSIDGGALPSAEKIPFARLASGVWPQSIVSALFPNGFGGEIGGEDSFTLYIGVFPLFLAVIAIWRSWRNVWVRYLTRLSAVAFAYSLGGFSLLHGVLYAVVPFLWMTRSAGWFIYLISFALAVLAAFGMDALLDPVYRGPFWNPARQALKWIAIAAATALILPGIFTQFHLDTWNGFSLLLILGSCGWFARLTKNPAGRGLRLALAGFILFDLAAFNWAESSKAELTRLGDPIEQVVSLRGAAEFVKARNGLDRVRVSAQPEPNIGDLYGIQSVGGGGTTVLANYPQLGKRDDLLNVRYYIKPVAVADPGPVYQDAKWKVYENPNAYPRGWIVHEAVVEPSHEAVLRQLDQPGINLRRQAVLETPLPNVLQPPPQQTEPVRFRSYDADHMELEVDAASAGLLVLSEMYYPGWVATVNGKDASIYQVDGALRGITVPAGSSRIELKYASTSFRFGAAVSLMTLACVITGCLIAFSRFRRERRLRPPAGFRRPIVRHY